MTRAASPRSPTTLISLMVVDDHPMWRDTLRKVLEHGGSARVVAEASDGEEAIQLAAAFKPDVIVMDMGLPGLNGVEATLRLRAQRPGTKVLVLSSSEERSDVIAAVKAGASGYLVKTAASTEVTEAVQRVFAGELVFPPLLAQVVLDEFQRMAEKSARDAAVRLMVSCDPPLLRETFARMLVDAGFDVEAIVDHIRDLPAMIEKNPPNVVVFDVASSSSKAGDALEMAHQIRETHPDVGVLILCQDVDTSYAMKLMAAGARGLGYLLRDRVSNVDELSDAIRRIARGESVIDPAVVSHLVDDPSEPGALHQLTSREREVLALMAEGRSNQAISERLFLSGKTVEKHVRAIFTKFDLEEAADDHRRVLAVLAYLRST